MKFETIIICPICAGTKFKTIVECIDQTVSHEKFQLTQCCNCTFLITSPRPDSTAIGKYYDSPDYISHASSSHKFQDKIYFLARKYALNNKRKLIERHSLKGKVLDVGCGAGEFLKQMKLHGWETTGTEPNTKAQSIAKNLGITIHNQLFEITQETYQAITLWHVLEHVHELNLTIEKIKDLLHKNGTIFIAVPNHKSSDAKYYKENWAAYDVPRHLWHFDQITMTKLLEKHELKLIQTLPMKLDSFYVSLLSEGYLTPKKSKVFQMTNALIHGLTSNIRAKNSSEYSSLIYIVKK